MAPLGAGLDEAVTPTLVQTQPVVTHGPGWAGRGRAARPNKPERGDGARDRIQITIYLIVSLKLFANNFYLPTQVQQFSNIFFSLELLRHVQRCERMFRSVPLHR